MTGDLIPAAVVSCVFLAIFGGGELVRHRWPDNPEVSRKFVHCAGGLTALTFPWLFDSPWTVAVLAAMFAGIIFGTKRFGLLGSVHGVARRSSGALYFPVAVSVLFFVGHRQVPFYLIAILALTVSDTLAALVGTRYGAITYDVEDSYRTLEGSFAFFLVTYLCVQLPLLLMTGTGREQAVLVALVIALLVTGFEAVSIAGSDNVFVPLGTYFMLVKMTRHDLADTVTQTGILFLCIAVTVALSLLQKVFKPSGLVGMILVNYAAWSLCSGAWFVPLLLAQLLLILLVYRYRDQVPEDITHYQVKVLFYTTGVPVLLIFAANGAGDYDRTYLPYLAAIVTQLALIYAHFLAMATARPGDAVHRFPIPQGLYCIAVATAAIAVIPVNLSPGMPPLPAIGMVLAGAAAGYLPFRAVAARLPRDRQGWLLRQRLRMACSAAAAALVWLLQRYLA